jgi:hypothetical protein
VSEAYRELLVRLDSSAALLSLCGASLFEEYRRLQLLSAELAPAELGDLVLPKPERSKCRACDVHQLCNAAQVR